MPVPTPATRRPERSAAPPLIDAVPRRSPETRDELPAAPGAELPPPRAADAWDARGEALAGIGRLEEARDCYARGLAQAPDRPRGLMNLASALFRLRREAEALPLVLRTIDRAPGVVEAWSARATLERRLGQTDRALRSLLEAQALLPERHPLREQAQRDAARLAQQGVVAAEPDALALLAEAWQLARGRSFDAAIARLEECVALEPTCGGGWLALGDALSEAGRGEEALERYAEGLRHTPGDARLFHARGRALAARKRFDEAAACFTAATDHEPRQPAGWSDLGRLLAAVGRRQEALHAFERAIALDPDAAEPWLNQALAEDALGRHAAALASYAAFLERVQPGMEKQVAHARSRLEQLSHLQAPPSPRASVGGRREPAASREAPEVSAEERSAAAALVADAETARREGRPEEAAAAARRATAADPSSADGWAALAAALLDGRGVERRDALDAASRAAELRPGDASFHVRHARALLAAGRPREALSAAGRAVELDPDDPAAASQLGHARVRLGDAAAGLEALDRAVARASDDADAHFARGTALADLRRHEDAVGAFERCLALQPDRADAWYNRALALFALRHHQEAAASCDRAIALAGDHVRAWRLKGDAYDELGWNEQALDAYDEALTLSPGDAVAFRNKAMCLGRLGRHAEAARCFEQRLEREPGDADAVWGLALCLDDGGAKETAAAAYRHYLGLEAGNADREGRALDRLRSLEGSGDSDGASHPIAERSAPSGLTVTEYLRRAAVSVNQREYQRALALYDQAREADPEDSGAWTGSGDCLRALGRTPEAAETYAAALRLRPGNHALEARLGEVLLESGHAEEALALLGRATRHESAEARAWDALGRAFAALDRHEEALVAFQKGLAKDAQHALIRFHEAQALVAVGRHAEALEAFRIFVSVAPPQLQLPIREARERMHALAARGG